MELFKDFRSGCEADLRQPLLSSRRANPPYIPKWDLMPLDKLCRLALTWHTSGFTEEAGKLAFLLLSLGNFPYFWCPENQYNEENTLFLLSQLEKIPPIESPSSILFFTEGSLKGAFTTYGNGTSLGAMRVKEIEIRAMGPQAFPLNDSSRFGIKGSGTDLWVRSYALPEVWMELGVKNENGCRIDVRIVGLVPEHPMAFVFYVKARNCQVGSEILQPKSLRYFQGEIQSVVFENLLQIESAQAHKVQVIPLAGEGCFWNTEFLVSFEIHPLLLQASFTIKQI